MRNWKILMTAVVYQDEIITWDFLPTDETMNGTKFLDFLRDILKPALAKKRTYHFDIKE